MPEVTVILPAFNEERSIGATIEEIRALPLKTRIFVIDNLSEDNTAEIAYQKKAYVFYELTKGKGYAVRRGFGFARTPFVVMLNSDCTYPAKYIVEAYNILKGGNADIVMGYRKYKEGGSMSRLNKFGNWCLSWLASILYCHYVRDVCTGFWVFRREALQGFNLTSAGFTLEADMFVNAVRQNCKIAQIPIGYRARLGGSDAKLIVWDGFKIGWFLIKRRFV